MIIGVPAEVKDRENRVAVTPGGVTELVQRGHEVVVEKCAGVGSGFSDAEYQRAGAKLIDTHADIFAQAEMVMKVKEPQESEYPLLREGLILFTYLHLAANESVTRALLDRIWALPAGSDLP